MNTIVEAVLGVNKLTDQVIAMDYLISVKNATINYAMAITESATPEVREALHRQLHETIAAHESIISYLMSRGVYHPYSAQEQINVDLQNIKTALSIPSPS
ncbi:spore coat protein [Paenibacillus sp. GD4]|jgi:similar to spore coat protein|uniref:spore coat protein n=1 Tax=Paenibacillus TaxID=44249 RepID=UPI002542C25E|nr:MULTISPECIES: spore coat protein [Paenibacillus]MDQ1911759.1 spore coat protein [Paenibacillus sp. GD4]